MSLMDKWRIGTAKQRFSEDALATGSGAATVPPKRRDLGDVAGAWQTDEAVESVLAAQDEPDEDLWILHRRPNR